MRGADRRDHRPPRPGAARVRAGRGRLRGRSQHVVLRGARRVRPDAPLPRPHVAAPLRVPAARLRRVHDVLGVLQEPAAGHPRPAHRADGRRDRRAPLQAERRAAQAGEARDRHGRRRGFVEGRTPAEIDAELARERGRPGLARGARGDQGPLVQHGDRRRPLPLLPQLVRRPEHRLRVGRRPRAGAPGRARRSSARPRSSRASATGSRRSTARCSTRRRARRFDELLELSRTVFPYVEEHKFFCDYWFLTRWWNKVREFGALLATHGFLEDAEDVFQLGRHEVAQALDELVLTWSTGGAAARPDALAADRRAPQGAARAAGRVDAAAGDRRDARGDQRPGRDHALGRHDAARPGVGERGGGRRAADGRRCVARRRRGRRARRDRRRGDRATSARARSSSARSPRPPGRRSSRTSRPSVTDIGGVMSHAAIVCREYGLPAVVGTGRATVADPHRADDPRRRLERRRHGARRLSETCRPATPARSRSCGASDAAAFGGKSANLGELLSAGIPVPPGFAVVAQAPSATSSRRRGSTGRSRRAMARASTGDVDAIERRVEGDRRGDALRARCRTPSGTSSRRATTSWRAETGDERAAGRRPLERARRGQRGRDLRRPAGELPLGARRRARLRRGARLLGEPLHARARSATGRLAAREERSRRWASPSS